LPTRITLLTLFGMMVPLFWVRLKDSRTQPAELPAIGFVISMHRSR
jgi:hypothetical protein